MPPMNVSSYFCRDEEVVIIHGYHDSQLANIQKRDESNQAMATARTMVCVPTMQSVSYAVPVSVYNSHRQYYPGLVM